MPTERTIAHVLFDKGFRVTMWIPVNGTMSERRTGMLDPDETDPVRRYGNPDGLRCKGWDPVNYASTHSTGLNSLAPGLAPKVLGCEPAATDMVDLCFINGATAWVLKEAAKMGLLVAPAPFDGDKPTPTKPIEPTAPDFAPAYKKLRAAMAAARVAMKDVPEKGGGAWLIRLREVKAVLDKALLESGALEPK